MLTCYRCGKLVKGKVVQTVPSVLAIRMGIDFPKAFHPLCHEATERDAARGLGVPFKYEQPA